MRNVPREITIRPALNGYICKVGCQTVVFQSRELMITALRDYLENPNTIEALYQRNAMHKEMLTELRPECPLRLRADGGLPWIDRGSGVLRQGSGAYLTGFGKMSDRYEIIFYCFCLLLLIWALACAIYDRQK